MTFQKGNQLWKKGLEQKKEKEKKIESFLITLADGGMENYARIMDGLANQVEPSKADIAYMDRLEGWREYVVPKLARNETTDRTTESR